MGDGHRVAMIDTPATHNALSTNAISASNMCLIPARPSPADIEATLPTLGAVRKLGKPFAFVLNQAPPRGYKAFELMTANVKANLDYANKLRKLKTPLEFFELSTTHARKQFELIISQTAALGALSRSLTKASAERMSAGIEKVFGDGQLKT
jgi:MinD-like ATPase involved in chromosome partitioning or flagellar assembly